jgi:Flp pilus assembly protein CpaB
MTMTKRIILKTVLVCVGIFIIISGGILYYFYNYIDLDTEKRITVYVATTDINAGDTINESMIAEKEIRETSVIQWMILTASDVIGKKSNTNIKAGDYLASYNFIDSSEWFSEDERYTILELGIKERLAGLVKKNSLVDILVESKTAYDLPKVVLPKVKIIDIIDEFGNSVDSASSEKKLYAKLLLNREQRDLLFVAKEIGNISVELYCNTIQEAARQQFTIPQKYYNEEAIIESK